jgi:hypothetical protein
MRRTEVCSVAPSLTRSAALTPPSHRSPLVPTIAAPKVALFNQLATIYQTFTPSREPHVNSCNRRCWLYR